MHNNRGYHQEVMHVQRMSNRRDRVASLRNDIGPVGTRLRKSDHRLRQAGEFDGDVVGRSDYRPR